VGRGTEGGASEVFKHGQKQTPGYKLSLHHSRRLRENFLLTGQQNALCYCAQSANSISSLLFVCLYTTAIVSPYLCGSFTNWLCVRGKLSFSTFLTRGRNEGTPDDSVKRLESYQQDHSNLHREDSVSDRSQGVVKQYLRRRNQYKQNSSLYFWKSVFWILLHRFPCLSFRVDSISARIFTRFIPCLFSLLTAVKLKPEIVSQGELIVKGTRLCARASVICFFFKDNRTVLLTRQDFLPDRTTEGDLFFTFSSNISDFRRSLSSYLKFGQRHEDLLRFCR